MSLLPVGTSTLYVTVHPQLGSCTSLVPILVIADPMMDSNLQPGAVTAWNAGTQRYDFQGAIPNVGGVLPLVYTTPSLPLVGTLESKLSAGLFFIGSLQLNGQTTLTVINASALARLLNNTVYNSTQSLLGAGAITFNRNNLAASTLALGQRTLFSFNTNQQVFSGVARFVLGRGHRQRQRVGGRRRPVAHLRHTQAAQTGGRSDPDARHLAARHGQHLGRSAVERGVSRRRCHDHGVVLPAAAHQHRSHAQSQIRSDVLEAAGGAQRVGASEFALLQEDLEYRQLHFARSQSVRVSYGQSGWAQTRSRFRRPA